MFLRGWPVKIKLKFTRNLSVWKPVQNLIKICSVVSKNNRQDALKTTKHYAFTSISCTTKTHHSYMTSSRTSGNKNAAGSSETLVPTYTASHTEDRNQNAKIYHCNSVTGVHMGQNVAKKITHGIWCMIFPKKETKMSQPHGLPSQFQISSGKLIEYLSTSAEHKFSEGSVDLFSWGRFITETQNTSLAALFCTNKHEEVTVARDLSFSSTPSAYFDGSGSQTAASLRGGPVSIPGQSTWDLRWI